MNQFGRSVLELFQMNVCVCVCVRECVCVCVCVGDVCIITESKEPTGVEWVTSLQSFLYANYQKSDANFRKMSQGERCQLSSGMGWEWRPPVAPSIVRMYAHRCQLSVQSWRGGKWGGGGGGEEL